MIHQTLTNEESTSSDIEQVLSVNKTKNTPTCPANIHHCYVFMHTNTSSHQLVDRGANGGLDRSEMCVLNKTGHKINIIGIDNPELTGFDNVSAASLLATNQGKIIGIFHEYAHLGKDSSIHSPSQMEWYKVSIDDKSVKVGGTQHIQILEGYALPLSIKNARSWCTN